jgi:hypothetical protein
LPNALNDTEFVGREFWVTCQTFLVAAEPFLLAGDAFLFAPQPFLFAPQSFLFVRQPFLFAVEPFLFAAGTVQFVAETFLLPVGILSLNIKCFLQEIATVWFLSEISERMFETSNLPPDGGRGAAFGSYLSVI